MFTSGDTIRELFDLEHAALKDVRALGGEVVEVPVKPGKIPSRHVADLGEHLAQFMCNFTGRGYALSREAMNTGDSRYVREPGYEAYGLKLFVDGNRILIGRIAVLMDETILGNYLRHLKNLVAVEKPKTRVEIDLPDGFTFGSDPEPAQPE